MKPLRVISLIILVFISSCGNFYGDLDLGGNFYYMTEPSFNDIYVPTNKKKPYSGGSLVIRDIVSLGYNSSYILATSNRNDTLFYWIINKNKKSQELGYDNYSNLRLSNLKQVDSVQFHNFVDIENIELKPKLYYQRKAGWKK
uniref:hypothetical protein n=1 Tax=uncultured Draconibacterium sp. TaxID=1573823 RepID=UPI003217EAF3